MYQQRNKFCYVLFGWIFLCLLVGNQVMADNVACTSTGTLLVLHISPENNGPSGEVGGSGVINPGSNPSTPTPISPDDIEKSGPILDPVIWLPARRRTTIMSAFTVSPTQSESPLTVNLLASHSVATDGSPLSYSWTINEQNILGSSRTATITFYGIGTQTAILSVKDSITTKIITATQPPRCNAAPVSSFTTSATQGQAPLVIILDASSSTDSDGTIVGYNWNASDGQQTSGGNQQITFVNAGTYTITLTVTDNDGLTGQTQQTVTVTQQNLVPDIRIEPTTLRFDNAQRSRRGFKHANDSLILKESIVGNEFLFITTDSQPDAKISQPTITRLKYVDINPIALSQEAENKIVYTEKVILNLFPDVTYIATNTAINYHSKGHYTWIGKIENLKFGDVTLVVKNGKITGNINANGTVYRIRPMKNGHHAIQQIDASAFPQYEPTSSLKPKLTKYDSMTSRQRRKTRKDDGSTIDVMVVYTSSAADASSDIESEIELAIAETNQAYANSDIQQRLRLVHTEQIDYTETGSFGTDLDRLESTSDDHIDNVHDLRDTHRADLVSFWVEGGDYCGLAPLMTNDTIVISFASHGFSVVARDCATAPQYSFGHELGHNMGAHHDSHVTGAHGAYDYSHGYVRATGDSSNSWRTILAYPNECSDNGHICGRIQYFSNPSILYDNNATGSDSANNRTTLNNTAAVIAAFRQSLNLPTKEETKSFSIHNEGNADLIVSSISMEGSASWISISPTSATVYRGSPVAIKVQVNYLSAPIGESTTRLLIHSNDPDENPYPMDIVVNRHSDTAGDKRELKDAVYAQNTGELSLAIEVPDATGQMEVSNATLKLVNSALVFQLNNISSLASKPPGDISSYDPRTTNVNIPIVNVPDTQGKPQLFKVTMQPVPSGIDQVFWFQVTEAIRIEVPIVE